MGKTNAATILLAYDIDEKSGKPESKELNQDEAILHQLGSFIRKNHGNVLVDHPGGQLYTEDIFSRRSARESVEIFHLINRGSTRSLIGFRSRSGHKKVTFKDFARQLSKFPRLNLVILDGLFPSDLMRQLLAAGIPMIAAIQREEGDPAIIQTYYHYLLLGKNCMESIRLLERDSLHQHQIVSAMNWKGGSVLEAGLYLFSDESRKNRWRLRNPMLIPVAEQQTLSPLGRINQKTIRNNSQTQTAVPEEVFPAQVIHSPEKSREIANHHEILHQRNWETRPVPSLPESKPVEKSVPQPTRTILAEGTVVEGHIESNGDIAIGGKMIGDIKSNGRVSMYHTGFMEGDIHARDVSINGELRGNIEIERMAEIRSRGKVYGDIRTAHLVVELNGIFQGSCITRTEKE